jgi:hypothetical protein
LKEPMAKGNFALPHFERNIRELVSKMLS